MAVSILDKLRTLVMGGTHSILNAAIDWGSVPSLEQYARDLEKAIEELEEQVIIAEGSAVTARDNLVAIEAKLNEVQATIDFILTDGNDDNDHRAQPFSIRKIGLKGQRKEAEAEFEQYKSTVEDVSKVVIALNSKLEEVLAEISVLKGKKKTAAAKNKASKAIKMASQLSKTAISVDNIGARITKESNIADARLKRALGSIHTDLKQDDLLQQAQADIEKRKAELQKKRSRGKK